MKLTVSKEAQRTETGFRVIVHNLIRLMVCRGFEVNII